MNLGTRKRGLAAGGDDSRGAALLGALGLGSFARPDLFAPPDGLNDLAAAVDTASGRITVSLGGDRVAASPADLAAALALPLGPVGLAPEVDAAVFSSAEAIATVRGFIHDRLLLGDGGSGGALPEEALAALQLVEKGKAYAVDWGRLVWAVLKREVLTGEPRRYSQYLLRLITCQRPELFSEADERLLTGKRRKSLMLQQCQRTDGQLVDCSEAAVEEENLLHGNSDYYQCRAEETEVEDGLVFGVTQNNGKLEEMPIFVKLKDQQHVIEIEDEGDDYDNGDDGLSPPVIRNDPHLSFSACLQRILAAVPNMEDAVLDIEKTFTDTQVELQHMREEERQKDNKIKSIVEDIMEELQARHTKVYQLEQDKKVMICTFQQCKKLFAKSSAAFLEHRIRMSCGEGGESSSDVVGMVDGQKQICWLQHLCAHQMINNFQKHWLAKYSACVDKITGLATRMTDLSNRVQRLKDSRSVPDLNNGEPQL